MWAQKGLLALTFLNLLIRTLCSDVQVITKIHSLSCTSTSLSLPPTGWISTNGSSVPFVFSPTHSKTHRSHTRSRNHQSLPPAYSSTAPNVVSSHRTRRTHRTSHAEASAGPSSHAILSSLRAAVQSSSSTPSCVPAIPSPIACPASNGTLYTPPGECVGVNSYVIACDTEAGGYELASNPNIPDVPSCIQVCDADPNCVAIAYDTNTHECYEKSTLALGNLTVNPNVIFAYQQRRGGTLPSASLLSQSASPTSSSGLLASSSASPQISSSEISLLTSTSSGSAGSSSLPVSSSGQAFFSSTSSANLQSSISAAQSIATSASESSQETVLLTATSTTTGSPTPSPSLNAGPVCSAANGTEYSDTFGNEYIILCDIDFIPESPGPSNEPDFSSCISSCSSLTITPCVGVTFENGLCFYHPDFEQTFSNSGVSVAILASILNPSPSSSVNTTAPPSTSAGPTIETSTATGEPTSSPETFSQTSSAEASSSATRTENGASETSISAEGVSSTETSSIPGSTDVSSTESSTEVSTTETSSTESASETSIEPTSTESSTEPSTTNFSSSTSLEATTTESSSSSTSSARPMPTCPQADGTVFQETDGSLYLIVCAEDYRAPGDNFDGINPVPADSLGACLDICMNQGTACMGAAWVPSTQACWMKHFMQIASYPSYEVDSFVRGTGPNGESQGRIGNQYFSGGQLAPWVSSSASNGAQFQVVNGAAAIHLTLVDDGGGIPGGDDPSIASEEVTLSQSVSIPSGQNWFFYTTFSLTRASASPMDPGCTLTFRTQAETLWTYDYGTILDLHTGINASGTLNSDASQLICDIACTGAGDADISFDNFAFATFGQSAGANPRLPQVQIIQNPTFDSVSLAPWISGGTTNRATVSVSNGQAFVDYNGINNAATPVYIYQHVTQGQRGQTYTLNADVYVNLGGNTNCQGSIFSSNVQFWSFDPTNQNQHYQVNVQGTLSDDVGYWFNLYSTCSGDTVASVAWDNVCFTLNT